MRKNYDVVIIGGGIQGLSLAYYLARVRSDSLRSWQKQTIFFPIKNLLRIFLR